MGWLKRNLVLVVGVAVALVLLAAAGYFLWTKSQANADVSSRLTDAADTFTRLNQANPSITEENVQAARDEQKRAAAMLEENRKHFEAFGAHTNMDSAAFKSLLETTIAGLNSMASSYGVARPKDFSYTFSDQRKTMQFEPSDLLPWTYQLLEIQVLCEAVYRTRVHSMVALRRARATARDLEGRFYIIPKTGLSTNATANAVICAYEVVFQGFTSELAGILKDLAASPHAFVVKNINIQPSDQAPAGDVESPVAYQPYAPTGVEAPVRQLSPAELMRQRYGISRPGGGLPPPPPQPTWTPAVRTRRGPETVLDERLLRFTMRVDAIRPLIASR